MPGRNESAEQLRQDIDRGLTGDKIPAQDPAAAPLGTDDEAAGAPPSSDEVRDARRREVIGRPPDPGLARGPETSDPKLPRTLRPIYAIAFLFGLIFLVTLILALWSLA